MSIKISIKTVRYESTEVVMAPEQFVIFDSLYHSKDSGSDGRPERCELSPTFEFDNGEVYSDESWCLDKNQRVGTSSYQSGVMGYSEGSNQYVENYHRNSKLLGQLVSVSFSFNEDMQDVFNIIEAEK